MEPLTMGLILGGASLGTGLLNTLITVGGAKAQRREGAETRVFQRETFERTFAEEKRASRAAEKLSKEQLAMQKDINNFNKRQTFVNNFLTVLNKDPERQQQMINLSRGRR